MIVDPYKADDLFQMEEQDSTAWLSAYVSPAHAKALEGKMAYTGRVNGKIVVCAGLIEYWPGRAEAWACLSKDAGQHFLSIDRAVRRFLRVCTVERIEAAVDLKFSAGLRWVESLGFELEVPKMRKYFPDGRDAALFSMVK